jgi:cobalt-zinc-cadmium efflux system protein
MSETRLDPGSADQRRTLWIVLLLNLGLTAGFAAAGWIGDSSALLANALDSASDSFVFVLSLFAASRSGAWKRGAARVSAITLLLFAIGVIADTVRRGIYGSEPIGPAILVMGVIGAVANAICLWLLMRLHKKDVNLRAATTFSLNDFASNGGIFIAGGLVMWTGANWPDLAMGAIVAAVALYGGYDILKDAAGDARHEHGGQS